MIFEVIRFRLALLVRQKIAWAALVSLAIFMVLAMMVANASFIKPLKIFWDFSLAINFILQVFMALFLSTQLYSEESNKRTLHLLLSSGLSRESWTVGNGLGIFLALQILNYFSFAFSLLLSRMAFGEVGTWVMAFQNYLLWSAESLILIFLGLALSFCVRPLLALLAAFSLVALLHNVAALQNIFLDEVTGRFVNDGGARVVLWIARLLPPLDWFDLKAFVNYEASFSWAYCAGMLGVGILWAALLATLGIERFKRMDL